jgi:signal transduction histidine kinase
VLNNLLGNAFKFSRSGTTVTLAVTTAGDELEFSVADEGLGIPEKELATVFGDFTKTTTRATSGEHGSGLGLAICRRIVSLHGGEIHVESEVNVGSRFYFRLPAAETAESR